MNDIDILINAMEEAVRFHLSGRQRQTLPTFDFLDALSEFLCNPAPDNLSLVKWGETLLLYVEKAHTKARREMQKSQQPNFEKIYKEMHRFVTERFLYISEPLLMANGFQKDPFTGVFVKSVGDYTLKFEIKRGITHIYQNKKIKYKYSRARRWTSFNMFCKMHRLPFLLRF